MCIRVAVQEVRKLFVEPKVTPVSELTNLTWKPADLDGLVQYLVHDKQFSEERVRSAVEKMNAAKGKASQNRLESFFKVLRQRFYSLFCDVSRSVPYSTWTRISYRLSQGLQSTCGGEAPTFVRHLHEK